jgi:hypothetical protein
MVKTATDTGRAAAAVQAILQLAQALTARLGGRTATCPPSSRSPGPSPPRQPLRRSTQARPVRARMGDAVIGDTLPAWTR